MNKYQPRTYRIIFTTLVSFAFFSLRAQSEYVPGYIITLGNDTVQGFINSKNKFTSANSCHFKTNLDAKQVVYKADEINGYRFTNGRYYISARLLNYSKNVFLEYLLKGEANLYYYRGGGRDIYLVSKGTTLVELDNKTDTIQSSDRVYLRKSDRYKGQLRVLMNNTPELNQRFDHVGYNREALIGLSKRYHELTCTSGDKCVEFIKKTKGLKLEYGIIVSYGQPKLTVDDQLIQEYYWMERTNFTTNSAFSAGVLLNFKFLEFSRKFSLQIEPSYLHYSFKSDTKFNMGAFHEVNTAAFDINAIKIPVSLKYSFNNSVWKVHPYLLAGIWHAQFLNTSSPMTYSIYTGTDPDPDTGSYNFAFSSHQFGLAFGGGAEVPMKKGGRKILVGMKYEKGNGLHKGVNNVSAAEKNLTHTEGISFQAGFIF